MLDRLALLFAFGVICAPLSAQILEARNAGMGGTAVASSRYLSAGFFNPALLTAIDADKDDDWGLLLPAIGVYGSNLTLADDVDDYQNSVDDLGAALDAGSATPSQRQGVIDQLNGLQDQRIFAQAAVGGAVARPSKDLAVSLFLASRVEAQGVTSVAAGDVGIIQGANTSADLDNLSSTATVLGVAVSDVGLALAHEFDVGGTGLAVGLTPKYQRVDTYNYDDQLTVFDFDNADDSIYRNESSNFNVDAGLSWAPTERWMIGLAGRNLIGRDYTTVTTNGTAYVYQLDPLVTLGGAFRGETFTLALDVDLTKTERFQGLDDASQYLRIGGELDIADWLQLRLGYQHDFEDTVAETVTLGVGISPFDMVHLDLAVMAGSDDTGGAALQLALTF